MLAVNYENLGILGLETYGNSNIRAFVRKITTKKRGYLKIKPKIRLDNLDDHEEEC